MARNFQVNLTFTADTSAAKQQMAQLQQSLSTIASQPMQSSGINTMRTQIADAQTQALQLKVALQNATNVNTGKLNFNKFSQELKKNKMTLEQYAVSLSKLGPQGTQAFSQLANAIRQSEMPLVSLKGKVAALGTTLANTARWQISSMMLQGVMSAFRDTINYAKELNESLNNIRIVTGKSIDDMTKFADSANKAAKALSATTTEYTNASLIYYQQGLSDEQVKERTETTLKLAKVVGEEAATVSEWMTAIWNNFDNGTRSLENYADVLGALGAATASSADEIAGGLEKFAAVAETVGLSYDYAAAALATITAETRQSEDVVGTALKTIFARIEGLSLGETLEDGTTLNRYSESLYKVGVNIKDQNGNLKDMDTILDEIGSKWGTLNKDQQVALAQSVAGIRQYNQFIGLMSNWDVMQENLEIAKNATGELEKQHAIFEEGIEGATARVQAQLESIKNTLLDENDLIPILDFADNFLEVLDSILKSIGGMPGILILITSLITKAFGPQIANSIQSMTSGISSFMSIMSGKAQAARSTAITQSSTMAANMAISDSKFGNAEGEAVSKHLKENAELTNKEEAAVGKINDQYKETLSLLRQIIEKKQQMIQESAKAMDDAGTQSLEAETALQTAGVSSGKIAEMRAAGQYQDKVATFANTNYRTEASSLGQANSIVNTATQTMGADSEQVKSLTEAYNKLETAEQRYTKAKSVENKAKQEGRKLIEQETQELNKAKQARDQERQSFSKTASSVKVASAAKQKYAQENKKTGGAVNQLINAEEQGAAATRRSSQAIKEKDALIRQHEITLQEGVVAGQHWTNGLMSGISTMTSVASGMMMVTSSFQTLSDSIKNGELNFTTFLGAATSLLMGLGMFAPVIKGITTAMQAQNLSGIKGLGILTAETLMTKLSSKAKREKIKAIKEEEAADAAANLKKIASIFFNIGEQASQGPKGWITAAISAALVAALIGVAIAVNASNKAQNDEEEAEAQRTQKYADTVSEAYNKVRESYESLKESIEKYKGAQDAIGKLQKGTMEWKQAIQEANQQVIELIDAYPELAKYVSNVEGRLVISDEGMEAVLADQGKKMTTLANIKATAELEAKQARYEADRKAELTTTFDTYGAGDFFTKVLDRTAMGTTIGAGMGLTAGAGVGAIPGAVAGATVGLIGGVVEGIIGNEAEYDRNEEAIDALSNAYLEQGEAIFADFDKTLSELDITDPELITALKENKDSLEELVRTNSELIEQGKIVEQQKVDNLLMSQEHFVNANYGKGVQEAANKEYQKLKDKATEKYGTADDYSYGKWYTLGIAKGGTEKGEAAFKKYAEIMGYDDAEATDFKGDKVVFKYKEGDEVKEDLEVTYEDIEAAIAEATAADSAYMLANAVNEMTTQVRILQNSDDAMTQALGSFLENGDLSYLDPEIYEQIVNGNVEISEEQATLFGYDSVAAAEEAFSNALANYDAAIAKTNILAREQQNINMIISDGAAELEQSETAIRAYAESLANSSEYLEKDKEAAAKLAVQHYRTAIGVTELKKALNDNLTTLENSEASALDYYEALGAVKDSLEKTFGIKVSADFVKNNLEKIKSMASGSVDALQDLRKELVNDFIINLSIDEEYKTALQNEMTELMAIAENSPLHTEIEFDNTKAIEGINEALAAGAMTIEEVEAMFANANLALPQYNTAKIPNTTTSNSHTVVSGWWGEMEMDSTTSNTTWSEIPYFGDNPPVYKQNDSGDWVKTEGTGVESSFKVTTAGNDMADQDILSYGGKGTDAGETASEKKKRLDSLDDELDRYHEMNKAISNLETKLSRLGKAKERAFGANKLSLMQEEINKSKQLLKLEQNKLKYAENYYQKVARKDLLSSYNVKLDKDGNISNHNELIQSEINKLKAIKDPDSQAYKDQKDHLDQMKSDFEDYEKALSDVETAQDAVIEQQIALQDLAMEKIEYKIQMKVEMAEDDRKLAEFLMSKYEDDDFATAEKVQGYTDTTKADMKAWNANQKGIEKVQKDLAAGKISEEDAIAKLRELRDEQISLVEGMEETRASVFESLSTMFDAWNEKFDTQIAKIEHLKNVTQSYKNIVDIVGKDNLGISDETMKKFNQVNVQASQEQMYAARKKKEENEKYLADLQKARADAEANKQDTSYWDDLIEDAEEKVRESTEEFMGSWEEALQAAADAFAANVEQIAENFSEGVSGIYKNLDELEAAFERQTTLSDLYLKNYEKSYQISKLNRSIQDSIDKTDNLGSQKELRDLQRELLEMNKEGTKVSKYDIEYMQKKYDLMVAEQALKDAQNAKSTVRLRRDSEGNYGYVYTADQDTVGKAEQNYEDKLYAMQQFGNNLVLEAQKQYIALNQAYKDAMLEISQDMTLNDEEKKAKMAEITRYYQEQMQYWADQSNSIMLRGTEINAQYGAQMATSFHETIFGQMFPDINSFDQLYGQSIINMNGSTESFNGAVDELGRTVDSIMSDAGYDVEDFADDVDNYLGDAQEDLADTREESNELAAAMEEDMSAGVSAVENFESEYASKMESIRSETEKTIKKINKLIKRLNALDKAKDSANDDDDEDYSATGDGSTDDGTSITPTTTKLTTVAPTTTKPTVQDKIVGSKGTEYKVNGKWYTLDELNAPNKGHTVKGDVVSLKDGATGESSGYDTFTIPEFSWVWLTNFNKNGETEDYGFMSGGPLKIDSVSKNLVDGMRLYHWVYTGSGTPSITSGYLSQGDVSKLLGKDNTQWYKKYNLKQFNTGGYTGEWGPEGRMAMLHQKEIVLNAHDTENFLAAIGIVRDISDQIEKNAIAMQYINQLRGYGAKINPSNGTLQQDITIHAEFPNATNHSEIEEAFRNLGNLASQYANRKS